MTRVTFNNQKSVFFRSISSKVDQYFKENNLKRTGNRKLYIKAAILLIGAFLTYMTLLTVSMHPVLAIAICVLFGITQAAIGFNIMHDANHGSFSTRKWVNYLMGLTGNALGVNSWFWKQKHNVIHHTYTNVDGVDDDIIKSPFLRMCESQPRWKLHKFQFLYSLPLYGFTTLMWIFFDDFEKYFRKEIQGTELKKMELREHFVFWASKILYVLFFVLIPMYIIGIVPFIIGFLIIHFSMGISLAIVFQLAHVVEKTHFEDANHQAIKINDEWAVHQIRTTADFATHNKVIGWFTGGLNFQVEHHLFPHISHVHYPVIHNIVKDACKENSIRFNQYPSMMSALISHLRFLKQLGKA